MPTGPVEPDRSWQALLAPGRSEEWFAAEPLPPLTPWNPDWSVATAWWLSELSRLVYRNETDRAQTSGGATRDQILARVGLREVWFGSRAGTQCALVQPRTSSGRRFTVLVFRGTDELRDWVRNLRAVPAAWSRGGRVHAGFARALHRIWRELRERLERADGPLVCTGHSLGGALALLAASRVPAASVWTFGAPRVGDRAFARALHDIPVQRVVNGRDLVPQLPPPSPLFLLRQFGQHRPIGQRRQRVPAPGRRLDPPATLADHAAINYSRSLAAWFGRARRR